MDDAVAETDEMVVLRERVLGNLPRGCDAIARDNTPSSLHGLPPSLEDIAGCKSLYSFICAL
jgi:hypothetical protein